MGRVVKDESLQIPTNYMYKKIETVLRDKKNLLCTYNTWGSMVLKFFRTIVYQALCLKRAFFYQIINFTEKL